MLTRFVCSYQQQRAISHRQQAAENIEAESTCLLQLGNQEAEPVSSAFR